MRPPPPAAGGGAGAFRFSRSFFLRRRSFAQRTFGLEPRPMGARLPSGPWRTTLTIDEQLKELGARLDWVREYL